MNATIPLKHDWLDYTDVFLDPVIVIITFVLAYWLANIQSKRKNKKELNNLFEYFSLYLTKQTESINKQIKYINEHALELEALKPFNGPAVKFTIQPYHLLESMNKENLVQSFKQKGIESEKVMNIISYIDLTKITFDNYREYHKGFLSRQNDARVKWNSQMIEFHQLKTDLLNRPPKEVKASKELMKLNELYNSMIDSNSEEMGVVYDDFIIPLEKYFQDIYSKDHNNKYANLLMPKLQFLQITYHEGEASINQYKNFLSKILGVLEDNLKESEIEKYCQ
ncbi:MAG: hypothetical protein ACI8XB_002879 [Patiriisocius sp.]|jgi:hypothetical protein